MNKNKFTTSKESKEIKGMHSDMIITDMPLCDYIQSIGFEKLGSGWYSNNAFGVRIKLCPNNEMDFWLHRSDVDESDNELRFRGRISKADEILWVLDKCFGIEIHSKDISSIVSEFTKEENSLSHLVDNDTYSKLKDLGITDEEITEAYSRDTFGVLELFEHFLTLKSLTLPIVDLNNLTESNEDSVTEFIENSGLKVDNSEPIESIEFGNKYWCGVILEGHKPECTIVDDLNEMIAIDKRMYRFYDEIIHRHPLRKATKEQRYRLARLAKKRRRSNE